jgi:hypothetical protein
MGLFRVQVGAGLTDLSLRIQQARAALPLLLADEVQLLANNAVMALSDAAPRGKGEGGAEPIGNDAPGRLFESFHVESNGSMAADVLCNQPQKLSFIVNGRGPVRPVRKKALMWKGLSHPVKYARATEPNDFVTPALDEVLADVDASLDHLLLQLVAILEGE